MACSQKSDEEIRLVDYAIAENQSPEFLLAQSFRNSGSFHRADSVYQLLLLKNSNSPQEKEYLQLNQLLCQFAANDTLYIEASLNSTHFKGLSSLVRGISLARKDQSGFEELYKARRFLQEEGLTNSFFFFLTIEQLGLAHRQNVTHVDSTMFYYKQARNFLSNSNGFEKHKARIAYRLAKIYQVNRDEVTAIGLLDEAMVLDSSTLFWIDVLVLKAGLLRAEGRIEESDQIRNQVNELALKSKSINAMFKVLNERALYYTSLADDTAFFKTIEQLKTLSVNGSKNTINRLLSRHYFVTKKYSLSILYGEAALTGYAKERFPDSKLVFEALYFLCYSYTQLGNYKMGMRYAYQQLVYSTTFKGSDYSFENAIEKEVQDESYNFVVYDLLGSLYLKEYQKTGNYSDLKNSFRLYSLIDSLMVAQVRTQEEESVLEFLQIGHGIYSNALEVCHLLYERTPDTRWIEAAHLFMERSKSMATHQDILKHDENYFPNVPLSIKKRELELKTTLASIKRQNLENNSKQLQQALKEQDHFFQSLEKEYPEYYLARYSPLLSTVAATAKIAVLEKKSIVSYHLSQRAVYIIHYGQKTEFKAIELPIAFTDSLLRFRQLLSQPSLTSLSPFKRLSQSLYQTLVQPLNNLQQNLEIVPEGVLSYMPFEVLISDTVGNFKTLPYLIKKHTINYKFSLKSTTTSSNKSVERIVGYAYTSGTNQLRALPGSQIELKIIEEIFQDSHLTMRNGPHASRKQFLMDIEEEVDLLHISMHATSDPGNRLLNGIYFNSEKSIDTVFGFEIVPMDVQAHTVVITSCESGFGTIIPGEGTFSLARSFQQTGVKNIIASLWSLPDYSSPMLCKVMYEKIKAGDTPALALTKSKTTYLQHADANLSNPFYWSGLTLVSN
jgi:CHAT domain-containing protein